MGLHPVVCIRTSLALLVVLVTTVLPLVLDPGHDASDGYAATCDPEDDG